MVGHICASNSISSKIATWMLQLRVDYMYSSIGVALQLVSAPIWFDRLAS